MRKPQPNALTTVKTGEIEFKDVSFHYPGRGFYVLRNFDMVMPAGQKIALVGHSGCGKSTITSLILQFYNLKANCGKILIDGTEISQYDVRALRKQIGYVMQEPVLFNKTIKENIMYGKLDATDEEVYIAADKANCIDFIEGNALDGQGPLLFKAKLEDFVKFNS